MKHHVSQVVILLLIATALGCNSARQLEPPGPTTTPTRTPTITPTPTSTPTPTPVVLPLVARSTDWNFVIERVEMHDRIGDYTAERGTYLVLVGRIENNSTRNGCLTGIEWDVVDSDGEEYSIASEVLDEVKEMLGGLDYPGTFFGICAESQGQTRTFVAFDVPKTRGLGLVFRGNYGGQQLSLYNVTILAAAVTATPPPTATPTFTATPTATATPVPPETATAWAQATEVAAQATIIAQETESAVATATQAARDAERAAKATERAQAAAEATAVIEAYRSTAPQGTWIGTGDGIGVVVGDFRYFWETNLYYAGDGAKFVGFGIGVVNRTGSTIHVNPFNVTLVDLDGRAYTFHEASFDYWNQPLEGVDVPDGAHAQGGLVFLIDNNSGPAKIIVDSGGLFSSPVEVDLRRPPDETE